MLIKLVVGFLFGLHLTQINEALFPRETSMYVMSQRDRDMLSIRPEAWDELRAVLRASHRPGMGAGYCVCGGPGGQSAACEAFRAILENAVDHVRK